MIPLTPILGKIWLALAIHLWQTSLVLAPVLLLSRWMRNAPARLLHLLWSIALLKVLLPISLLAEPLESLLGAPATGARGSIGAGSAAIGAVYAVLRPAGIVEALRSDLAGSLALLPLALTVLWAAGVAYAVMKLIARSRAVATDDSSPITAVAIDLRRKLERSLRGSVIPPECIRVCRAIALPHVAGWLRPRIVIPISMIVNLRPSELRAILTHEELHRRRRDPLRSAMLHLLGTILFFYPLMRILLRGLQDATELVCDERVVQSGVGGEAYARALARTLRLGLFPSTQPFTAGVGGGSLLRARFERISNPRRFSIMTRHRIIIGAVVLLVFAGALLPTPLVAGETEQATAKAKPSEGAAQGEMLPLDKMPAPSNPVPPIYPEAEKKDGITGEVHLRMLVTPKGTVDSLTVFKEVEGHPAFAEAALAAARQWTLTPGEEDGKPVACWIQVPFMFKLN